MPWPASTSCLMLTTQRQLARARMQQAQARAQRYLDTVQLFAAMGGGWVR